MQKDDSPELQRFKDAIKEADPPKFDVDADYARLKAAERANIHHVPRQEGPYLICISCTHRHTLKYIGPTKKLVGVSPNGEPMLENR